MGETGAKSTDLHKDCRKCGLKLVLGDNVNPSSARNRNWICRTCECAQSVRWQSANPERTREINNKAKAKYRAKDIDKARERGRNTYYRIAERNPGLPTASSNVSRALNIGAVPPELTRYAALEATLPSYRLAATLTAATGIKHEVDHIVPLALGGLHIPENLQVITAADHRRKTTADIKAIKEARNAARRQRRGW